MVLQTTSGRQIFLLVAPFMELAAGLGSKNLLNNKDIDVLVIFTLSFQQA
jgi:hypothetical protein